MSAFSPDNSAWSPVRSHHASRMVAEQIKRSVLAGTLTSGDRVGSEVSLAKEFGVGRSTMREAVKSLQAQGLVTVEPGAGGGIRVAPPRSQHFIDAMAIQLTLMDVDWEELLETQVAVESATAASAATAAGAEDVARLRALVDRAEESMGDREPFARLGVDFHVEVGRVTGNRVLSFFLSALGDTMTLRYVDKSIDVSEEDLRRRHRTIIDQHREICRAIESGDAGAARRIMSEHLCDTRWGVASTPQADAVDETGPPAP